MSNRLGKVFEVTNRDWNGEKYDTDEFLAAGRTCYGLYAQRAYVRGMAGRISADRTSRILRKLRSIYPCSRFHVRTARKMAEGLQPASVETVYCIPEPDLVI